MLRPLYVLILCSLFAACASSQPAPPMAHGEVEQASDRFWDARVRGDVSSIASRLTEDTIFMVPGLPDAVGRIVVSETMQLRFQTLRPADFTIHRREIHVDGAIAHELGWYSETHRGHDEPMRMSGRYLLVWQRGRDGVWRVHRNMFNFSGADQVGAPDQDR